MKKNFWKILKDEFFTINWENELSKVEQCPQRQDSLTDQMKDLCYIAKLII